MALATEAGGAAAAAAADDAAPSPMVHGSHNPKYGGVVLMNGDVRFEVVLRPGAYDVHFSDAARIELPAAIASAVTITVTRTKGAPGPVALHINDTGDSWTGAGRMVEDPDAVAPIAYTLGRRRHVSRIDNF